MIIYPPPTCVKSFTNLLHNYFKDSKAMVEKSWALPISFSPLQFSRSNFYSDLVFIIPKHVPILLLHIPLFPENTLYNFAYFKSNIKELYKYHK